MHDIKDNISLKLIDLRYKQLILNELLKKNLFKVPVHLAIGHEALAIGLHESLLVDDLICLTHRNIHFNLLEEPDFDIILDHFRLDSKYQLMGSMNLAINNSRNVYTSSILGNNYSIACGIALSKKIKQKNGRIFVLTGDGAIEEGAFWEAIVFAKTNELPIIFIIENNDFSMASTITERRCQINFSQLSDSLNISYLKINGFDYQDIFESLKNLHSPFIIEVNLKTFTNHAGPTPGWDGDNKNIDLKNSIYFRGNIFDPIFNLHKSIGSEKFNFLFENVKYKYMKYEV
jgi:TPP-dependent pyruvate/acetoin dehydrogenase alpha subunit